MIYVCMYVYMYVCMYVYMYVRTYVCIYDWPHGNSCTWCSTNQARSIIKLVGNNSSYTECSNPLETRLCSSFFCRI